MTRPVEPGSGEAHEGWGPCIRAEFGGEAVALALGSLLPAQQASLTVIHGIPGLPAPVEVFANNSRLFSFAYGDSRGPLSLAPATYNIEVVVILPLTVGGDHIVDLNTVYLQFSVLDPQVNRAGFALSNLITVSK